jgi:hypothetical protein
MKISAYAKVTVTLEISAGSSWGLECKMDQIHKQAGEDVIGQLNRLMGEGHLRGAKIIGIPKVLAIMASIDKDE